MKIIFLSVVCLLMDVIKGEECVDSNITFQAFLNETKMKEYFVVSLGKRASGGVCLEYPHNRTRQGCGDGPTLEEHDLCAHFNDSESVVLTSELDNKVKMLLDCPYVLRIMLDVNDTTRCDFTSPAIASTKDGKVTHMRNDSFYPEPSLNITDVNGGLVLMWTTPSVSETLLQNLTLCIDVYPKPEHDKVEEYIKYAEEKSTFILIKDNLTIELEAYFLDSFNRRGPKFKQKLTKKPSTVIAKFPEPTILKVSMIVLAVALVGLIWYAWRRKSTRNMLAVEVNDVTDRLCRNERENPMYFCENKEIKPSELEFVKRLGEGHFGEVCLMKWKTKGELFVAVKKLKHLLESETERAQYVNEIAIFNKVGTHENIVKMLGYNTDRQPWFIVMEFIDRGDLLEYLRRLRLEFDQSRRVSRISDYSNNYIASNEIESFPQHVPHQKCILPSKDMESFGRQIALGMEHLEACNVVHRDLAARNILLNRQKVIKITDFGLSRDSSYIRQYHKAELPIKWMAPETFIHSTTKCFSKSDVWSFGVVLWEIGTLGGAPYEGMGPAQLIGFLSNGNRLEKPEAVKDSLYALMMRCWKYDYRERPTFREIVKEFDSMSVYFELSDLKPDYMFPPV